MQILVFFPQAADAWSPRSARNVGAGYFAVATLVDRAVVCTSNFKIRR